MIRRWYGLKYHLSTGILASNGRDGPNFSREHVTHRPALIIIISTHSYYMWLINHIMDQLIESRIDQAIDALNDGFYSNCAQAARRLQRRSGLENIARTNQQGSNGGARASNYAIYRSIGQGRTYLLGIRWLLVPQIACCGLKNRTVGHLEPQSSIQCTYEKQKKPLAIDRKNSHSLEDMTGLLRPQWRKKT